MATRTLQEAEAALRSGGLTGRTLDMALTSLRNSYATGAAPAPSQAPARGLDLTYGSSPTSVSQQGPAQDPYAIFNAELARMLTRAQTMGTKRFAEQGFNAQGEQNRRILNQTPSDLIGANPNIQSSVRSNQAAALDPTISQAARAQQTFSEQIGGFKDAVESARAFANDIQARKDQDRARAAEIVKLAVSQGSTALSELLRTSPEIFKQAGYDTKSFEAVLAGLKANEVAAAAGKGGGGAGITPTGTVSAEQVGVLNDIANVLADPSFDQTFGVNNIVNRNNPLSPSYTLRTTIDQVINQLSLAARGQLKGQGQVSNYEGELLRKAQTALRYNLPPEAARRELKQVAGAIRTSSGLTAAVRITAPDGTSQTGMANQATISQAVADGNRVEYI